MNDLNCLARWRALGLLALFIVSSVHGEPACQVAKGRVNDIRLGAQVQAIHDILQKDFSVTEEARTRTLDPRVLVARENSSKKIWFYITVDGKERAVFMDAVGPCLTADGIGIGSTFGQAIKVYGRPKVSPSDVGYLITFDKLPGVAFLLNDQDIPENLRGIPDDVFKPEHRKELLKHRGAKIVAIQLYPEE